MPPAAPPEPPERPVTVRTASAWVLRVVLGLALLWLCLCGLLTAALQKQPPRQDAAHITQAWVQSQEGRGFAAAPAGPAPPPPGGPWREVVLPHAPRSDPLGTPAPPPGPVPTTDTWDRLPGPGADQLPAPLHLYLPRWKAEGRIAVYAGGRLVYQS